jgi:FKBP-type peptidyl-prolyl cis-trans isomerase 2
MHRTVLTTTLLLAVLPAAQANLIELEWSPEGQFQHQASIAAGKFVEICGKLPAAATVHWSFTTTAPVDFNVHYHAGKNVVFPLKLSAVVNGKDILDVKLEQDYCWMWINKSAAATALSVRLQR